MQAGNSRKEEKFKKRLQKVLEEQDLQLQVSFARRLLKEMDVSSELFAAALLYLGQPNLYQDKTNAKPGKDNREIFDIPLTVPKMRNVRYRLDVGRKHQIQEESLKELLVAESGVDWKRIGKVDIRHHYTILELPDGMPADIFQVLAELEFGGQKFNIKRLKPQRKFRRQRKPDQ